MIFKKIIEKVDFLEEKKKLKYLFILFLFFYEMREDNDFIREILKNVEHNDM